MSTSSIVLTILLALSVKTGVEALSCTACASTYFGDCLYLNGTREEMDCSTFNLRNTDKQIGDLAPDAYSREYVERLYQSFKDNPGKMSSGRTCAYVNYRLVDMLGSVRANFFMRGCMPDTYDGKDHCDYAKASIKPINVAIGSESLGCGTSAGSTLTAVGAILIGSFMACFGL